MLKTMVKIVPPKVQFKVSLLIILGLLALLLPAVSFSDSFLAPVSVLVMLVGELFFVWAFWPKLQWGTASVHLPVDPKLGLHLSFDDGPTAGLTDRILDLLKERQVKASFFVLVKKAKQEPALIKRMVAEGHQVGLHGADHRTPFFRKTPELQESLSKAKEELEKLTGQTVKLYRPSHGWKNLQLLKAAKNCGLQFCFWDFGVWDTDAPPPDVLIRRLRLSLECGRREAPKTLLLHDGRGDETTMPAHADVLKSSLEQVLPA